MDPDEISFLPDDWVDRGVLGRLDAGGLATRLRWAIGWVGDNLDVRPPPGSRLDAALRNLDELALANEVGADKSSLGIDRAIANHRSAWEVYLATVCAANVKYHGHPFTAEKFRTIFRGPEVAEGSDRSARNIEFELTVASRLFLGGVAVFGGEPDLRIHYGDELSGFAVKRVSSSETTQVKRSIKKAVEQIERSGMRGFIALNLEGRLENVTASPDTPEFFVQIDEGLEEVLQLSRYYSANPYVIGVFVTSPLALTRPTFAPNGIPELDMNLPWRYIKFINIIDKIIKGKFWENWESTLATNLRILSTGTPKYLPRT